jgi:hypothetical protein
VHYVRYVRVYKSLYQLVVSGYICGNLGVGMWTR